MLYWYCLRNIVYHNRQRETQRLQIVHIYIYGKFLIMMLFSRDFEWDDYGDIYWYLCKYSSPNGSYISALKGLFATDYRYFMNRQP